LEEGSWEAQSRAIGLVNALAHFATSGVEVLDDGAGVPETAKCIAPMVAFGGLVRVPGPYGD
jgi:hypothetical protein